MTNEERMKEINEKIAELKTKEVELIRLRDACNKDINKVFFSIVGKCYRNKSGCYLITGVPSTYNFNQIPCVTIDFIDKSICEDEIYVCRAGSCDTEEELSKLMSSMFEEITTQQFEDEALELANSFVCEAWTKKKDYEKKFKNSEE